MPTDWLFYWMTLPSGIATIAAALALPFLLWRLVLGRTFRAVGFKPLACGYALAAIGLVAFNFALAYFEYSDRVSGQLLPEAQRWSTVPGWAMYTTVLSLVLVLPLLGLLATPVSALLLRLGRFSRASIAVFAGGTWLLLVLIVWSRPLNEWHQTHRLQSLFTWMLEFAPGVLLIGLPFLLGVYLSERRAVRRLNSKGPH